MAVKGFDIKIGADTSAFLRALREMDKPIKDAQRQIQRLNEGLKLDPTNVTILTSKQQQLANSITDTKDRLKYLNQEEQKYQDLLAKNGTLTTEQQRLFQRIQGEIAVTEEELKKLQKEYDNLGSVGLQQVRAIGEKMEDLGTKIQGIGAKLSILSAGVAGLFGKGISYNMDIDKAQRAFETFTGSAEEAKEIIDNIRADSRKSLFGTNELINANKLLVSSGINAEIARKSINDMADILALSGGGNDELNRMAYNLQQIANNGKATARDIRQFGDAGIPIYKMLADTLGLTTEEVKDMDISFDILAETFAKATEEGGKFAHGQEIMAGTTAGSMQIVQKKFTETLGALTERLMPIVTRVMEKVIEFLDKLNENPALMNMITNIGLVLIALGPVVTLVGTLMKYGGIILKNLPSMATMTNGLKTAISALTSPIGIVIGVVAGLIAIFVHLYQTNEEFRDKVNEAWDNIVKVFEEHVMPAIQSAGELIGSVLDEVWKILQDIWGMIEPFVKKIFEVLLDWWNTTGSEILGTLFDILGKIFEGAKWLYEHVAKPIIDFLWNNLKPVFDLVFESVGDAISNALNVISVVWDNVKPVFESILTFLEDIFEGRWENIWGDVKNIFTSIFSGLGGVFKSLFLNKMISKINGFIKGINDVSSLIGGGLNIPLIPALAKGGIVNKATLAMVGEGKSAEAVMPLDKLPSLMAEAIQKVGGSNITLQFYPQQMTEAELEIAFNYVNRRFGVAY